MRILVLSGTGFIGSAVARALKHHELWVFHRGSSRSALPNVQHVLGDRSSLGAYQKVLRKISADVVLDMGLRNGRDAAQVKETLAGAAGRFVVVSSASVYRSFGIMLGIEPGEVDNRPMSEDAPLRRQLYPYRGAVARAHTDPKSWLDDYDKIPAEHAFLSCAELGASVIRLPMVYGPGDPDRRLAPYLKRMFDARPAVFLEEVAASWRNSRAFVVNAAEAIAAVVLKGLPQRVYNYAEPADCSEREWINTISQVVGWNGNVRLVAPADGGRWARPPFEEFPDDTNFAQYLRMDSSRIRHELHFNESVGMHAALRATIASVTASDFERLRYPAEEERMTGTHPQQTT